MREGWQTKTLGDVCHVYQPETISQKQMAGGEYAVYGANGPIGWHNQFNHEAAQLILGCRGSCGSVHITEPRSWINGNAMVVQPKTDLIAPAYLAYALRGGVDLKDSITGTAQPQITRVSLMPVAISYPEALPEQLRIVALLDEALAGLATAKANAERNLQNARAIFESHFQSAINQRGEGWEEKRLEDVCVIGDGNHSSNYPKKEELVRAGIPFIRATNLVAGGISDEDMRYLSPEKHAQLKKGNLKTGDILFTNRGEIGKTAIVDASHDGSNLNSQIAWLRCGEILNNRLLFHVLNSGEIKSYLESSKNGAALQQFTIRQIKELKIPIPPKDRQGALVARLDSLLEETQLLTRLYERKLAALEELKKSLLHQAFNGEL
jgi:type I restriction enzyme S subunit